MISGAGLCWQHVGGVGSTTTTTASNIDVFNDNQLVTPYIAPWHRKNSNGY